MATDTLTGRNHKTTLTYGATKVDGFWKTVSGGGLTGEALKNRPGGMGQEEAIPTPSTREPVTITREYKTSRDAGLFGPGGALETAKKDGDTFAITVQDLDHNAAAVGPPRTFTGLANEVSVADRDSEGNEVLTCTVTIAAVA